MPKHFKFEPPHVGSYNLKTRSQLPYLKDRRTRARYAFTLPFSTFRSVFTTSATRRSRSVRAAVSTAFFAASSQDFVLVPITSVTRYTESVDSVCLVITFPFYRLFILVVMCCC